MQPNTFRTRVQWFSEQMGGRTHPPPGPVYACTARLAEDAEDKQFSVALRFPVVGDGDDADLWIAAPEVLADWGAEIKSDSQLLLHEGRRVVGRCTVVGTGNSYVSAPLAPDGWQMAT